MSPTMNDTFRKLQSCGCSFRGFQAFLRRSEYSEYPDDAVDVDFGSIYYLYDEQYNCHGSPHINALPGEVLVKIFSFLPAHVIIQSVLPVCKYWHKLACDPVLWKRLQFACQSDNTYINMIKTVSQKYTLMRSLTLSGFRSAQQTERMMWHVGNHCSRLNEVQLYNCAIRSETLIRLGMTCPNIESLSLVRCDENYRKKHHARPHMKDASFVVSFPKLKSLVLLRSLATLSYDDAQNIVRICKSLKKLCLDCDFYGRAIRLIISSMTESIEVLWLQGKNYNDAMCQDIAKCRKIRELALNHGELITPLGLRSLGSLARLEKLLLFHAHNISAVCFTDFFSNKNMCNLAYVNLSGCKGADEQVELLIRRNVPKIREVICNVPYAHPKSRQVGYVGFGIYHG